jgi:hypothetical protein
MDVGMCSILDFLRYCVELEPEDFWGEGLLDCVCKVDCLGKGTYRFLGKAGVEESQTVEIKALGRVEKLFEEGNWEIGNEFECLRRRRGEILNKTGQVGVSDGSKVPRTAPSVILNRGVKILVSDVAGCVRGFGWLLSGQVRSINIQTGLLGLFLWSGVIV